MAIENCAEAEQSLKLLLDGFEELLQMAKTRPAHPSDNSVVKRISANRSRSSKTHRMILRKLILEELFALGGSANKRELYQKIEEKHAGKFLPGDYEYLPDGKRIVWQNYCDWEGTILRKEGVLKSDSPRGLWELSEGHK